MFKLFDDAALDAHIKSLQPSPSKPPRRQSLETMNVFQGTVCWRSKSPDRGFAFIKPDAPAAIEGIKDDAEVFVGQSVLRKCKAETIAKGDRVEFTTRSSLSRPGKVEIGTIRILATEAEAA
jgi:cold shock CspA family protein